MDDLDPEAYEENVNRIAEKIAALLNEIIDLKYRQFTKEELAEIEEKSVAFLEEYLKLYFISDILTLSRPNDTEFQDQASEVDALFTDLFEENKKLNRILKRQRVADEFQRLKQRFFAVSNTDTCMNYMKKLDIDAHAFQERLTTDKAQNYCHDLCEELNGLMERIVKYRSNTKKQVAIESVTGVLTLGTAAASGVAAAVGIAGRTASAAASASAPAAAKAVSTAGSTATQVAGAAPVVAEVAVGASGAAAATEVAVVSSTVAKTSVTVGKIVITAGNAIAEAINIGTTVTNARPSRKNQNRFRHELFRTFQESYSTFGKTTKSNANDDTEISVRTMARTVYENLINDEDPFSIGEEIESSVET